MRQRWKIFIAIVVGFILLVSVVTGARVYWLVQNLDEYTEAGSRFGIGNGGLGIEINDINGNVTLR